MYSPLKKKTRIFALIITLVMFFEIIPSIDFSTMTVSAATAYSADIINQKWVDTMNALDWEGTGSVAVQKESSSSYVYLPTQYYWHDTSQTQVNWVDINSVTIVGNDTDDKIGKEITITDGGTVPKTTALETKTEGDVTYQNAYAYDGTNYGGTVAQYAYRETMMPTFDGDIEVTNKANTTATTSSTSEESPVMLDVATSTLRILGDAREETVEVATATNTLRVEEDSDADTHYYDKVTASDLNSGTVDLDIEASLYYTVEYDEIFNKNYRTYYISTANQLAYLLYFYSYSQQTLHTDAATYGSYPSYYERFLEDGSASNTRIKFVFLNDLDLGGANGQYWEHYLEKIYATTTSDGVVTRFSNGNVMAYRNTQVYMTMEGNGHVIYNGCFGDFMGESGAAFGSTTQFLGGHTAELSATTTTSGDQYYFLMNFNFENMYSSSSNFEGGCPLLGYSTSRAYLYNIHCIHCIAIQTSKNRGSILLSGGSINYIKYCSVEESYVYGNAHAGLISSNIAGSSSYSTSVNINSNYPGYIVANSSSSVFTYAGDEMEDLAAEGKLLLNNGTPVTYSPDAGKETKVNCNVIWYPTTVPDADVAAATFRGYNFLLRGRTVINNTSLVGRANASSYDADKLFELDGEKYYIYRSTSSSYYSTVDGVHRVLCGPNIFEDSYTIDSLVFDVNSTGHSGTFTSCTDGGDIYNNCFSNCTIYAMTRTGVFCGNANGTRGTFMNVDTDGDGKPDTRTLVNTYFENCFTSGLVEGQSMLGGFIGGVFEHQNSGKNDAVGVCVFENCYSTSSVGMAYSGNGCGGFVGTIQGNVGTAVVGYNVTTTIQSNSDGREVLNLLVAQPDEETGYYTTNTGYFNDLDHLFVNCYAAGEVGGITTATTDQTTLGQTPTSIGGFFGEIRYSDLYLFGAGANFVNCYYDKQTTGMREKMAGDLNTNSGAKVTNYYDYYSYEGNSDYYYGTAYMTADVTSIAAAAEKESSGTAEAAVKSYVESAGLHVQESSFTYETDSNGNVTSASVIVVGLPYLGYFINAAYDSTSVSKTINKTSYTLSKDIIIPNGGYVISTGDSYTYDGTSTTAEVHTYPATLNGTLYDITGKAHPYNEIIQGVYTQSSTQKEVEGLTDTVQFTGSDAWQYNTEFYPQLFVYYDSSNWASTEQATLVKNYATASTATVFLSHYDTMLSEDRGAEYEAHSDDALVYDTIRDITQKFTFTSADLSGTYSGGSGLIAWECDQTDGSKNVLDGFIPTFAREGENAGYSLEYANGTEKYIRADNPKVLSIVIGTDDNNNPVYKCNEFSPGKQWVTVHYGDTGETLGERHLRLLPSVYLNAGGMITVQVVEEEDADGATTLSNTVELNEISSDGTSKNVELDHFTHAVGVVYALSDKTRMSETYDSHILTEYVEETAFTDDTITFAFYGRYGLTSAESLNNTVDELIDQDFTETKDENLSEHGETIVRIYETVIENESTLARGEEVECTPIEEGETVEEPLSDAQENYLKWTGQEKFDSGDTGYYYMYYYWRLDDGRYLYDIKLVNITSETHEINLVTGILDTPRGLVINQSEQEVMDVDQYIVLNNDSTVSHPSDSFYPSYQEDFNIENALDYYNKGYNYEHEYYDGLYYCNAQSLALTRTDNAVVCWKESDESEYVLTNIIIEVMAEGNTEWEEILGVAVDDEGGNSGITNKDQLISAQYKYNATKYTVIQDPETKLFIVSQITVEEETTLAVKYTQGENGTCNINIDFNMGIDGTLNVLDNIRVTALYRMLSPNIQADKSVLWVDKDYDDSSQMDYEAYNADKTYMVTDEARQQEEDSDTLSLGHPISWDTYAHGGSYTYRDDNEGKDVTVENRDQSIDNTGVEDE